MGIAPYKTFTFDGESSGDYGVYITGTGVFNAPERSVEMVEIAGRNGSFALDKGKFENIEATYRVGIVDDSEADFADRVSDFRNWLCSKVGYCRLEDEYNPNEYRMAVYASGVEIDHDLLIAGEAEITFNCKPQRWLTSGETAVTVTSGDTITNPTLFASSPLLEVYGYGDIDIGGQVITVENGVIGYTIVRNESSTSGVLTQTIQFDTDVANVGDDIYVGGAKFTSWWQTKYNEDYYIVSGTSSAVGGVASFIRFTSEIAILSVETTSAIFSYGTSSTLNTTGSYSIVIDDGTQITVTGSIALSYAYDGDSTITITATQTIAQHFSQNGNRMTLNCGEIAIESTKPANGNPMYIDLDIGECWNEDSGTPVSVNNAVIIPSKLPTLPSGNTAITFDNTITKLEVTPRWWKV